MAFYNRTPNLLLLEHVKDSVFYFLCGGIGRKGAAKKKAKKSNTEIHEKSLYTEEMGFFI